MSWHRQSAPFPFSAFAFRTPPILGFRTCIFGLSLVSMARNWSINLGRKKRFWFFFFSLTALTLLFFHFKVLLLIFFCCSGLNFLFFFKIKATVTNLGPSFHPYQEFYLFCVCIHRYVCRLKVNVQESVLSSYHVSAQHWSQAVNSGSRAFACLYSYSFMSILTQDKVIREERISTEKMPP